MAYLDDPAWQSLAAMRIEPDGASLTFAKRLARENGWSDRHTAKVIEEYRRFLYLAATSDTPLTPSDIIDQAWHLHLAYTRHYWGVLCAQIIGRPLHHGPTAGGGAEGRKYRAQYAETLSRYRIVFESEPPTSIWPSVGERFAARYQWVERSRFWVIPRARLNIMGLGAGAALVAACTAVAANVPVSDTSGSFDTILWVILGLASIVVAWILGSAFWNHLRETVDRVDGQPPARRKRRRRRNDDSGSGITGMGSYGGGGASGTAAGGAAFTAGGGDFGGGGADDSWDDDSSDSDSNSGGDSGCGSGCGD